MRIAKLMPYLYIKPSSYYYYAGLFVVALIVAFIAFIFIIKFNIHKNK